MLSFAPDRLFGHDSEMHTDGLAAMITFPHLPGATEAPRVHRIDDE
jgi:hypothetical protein